MDEGTCDRWSRGLGERISRRGLGGVAAGALGLTTLAIGADAKKKKKKKKKKPCVPQSLGTTCAGKCGAVPNNCGQQVNCGPCGYIFDLGWGGLGSVDGKFETPAGIAVDADSDVYVADTQNDRIQKFSNSGQFKSKWETEELFEEDSISTPMNITIRGNSVYVTSQFRSNIQVFNRNGEFQQVLSEGPSSDPGKLDSPQGLDTDSQGNLVIADEDNNRIQVLSNTGGFIREWGGQPTSADEGEFDSPTDVAVDSDGNSFVVDWGNNRVQKFSSTGDFLLAWGGLGDGDTNLDGPDGIAVDANDDVYVTDPGHQTIKKFTNNGGFITRIGSNQASDGDLGFGLKGIAVDEQGNVFVVDGDEVKKFRPPASASRHAAASPARAVKRGRQGHGKAGARR